MNDLSRINTNTIKQKSTKISKDVSKLKENVHMPGIRPEVGAPRMARILPLTESRCKVVQANFTHLGQCLCIMTETNISNGSFKAKHQVRHDFSVKARVMHRMHQNKSSVKVRAMYQLHQTKSSVKARAMHQMHQTKLISSVKATHQLSSQEMQHPSTRIAEHIIVFLVACDTSYYFVSIFSHYLHVIFWIVG
ncbi:hypothetical protein TanjilG_32234 [Lupinus angustifolius]|uniref:Uncharacterized protein n=1 Tax=Lupinus angustifolius TaxID=3871 RepID=A0A4P1RF75_LUPAN|nr:hypothetical protein TanjilG_32234 [Lupinus angustifolius]